MHHIFYISLLFYYREYKFPAHALYIYTYYFASIFDVSELPYKHTEDCSNSTKSLSKLIKSCRYKITYRTSL